MTRPRLLVALVVVLAAVGGVILWRSGASEGGGRPVGARSTPEAAPLDPVHVDADAPHLEGAPVARVDGTPPTPREATASTSATPRRVVAGLVVEPDGKPIPGAEVVVRTHGPEPSGITEMIWELLESVATPPVPPLARTTTDAQGRFHFEGGSEDWTRLPLILEASAVGRVTSWIRVEPELQGEAVIPLSLAGPGIEGTVVDEAGASVAGAVVQAMGASFGVIAGRQAVTDEAGHFELQRPESSEVLLLARAKGYAASLVQVPTDERQVRMVLERGATLRALVVVPGPEGTDVPVAGARIAVHVRPERTDTLGTVGWGVTNEAGEALVDVIPGTVSGLLVLHPKHPQVLVLNYMTENGGLAIVAGANPIPADARITPGENRMTFRIAGGVELTGRVATADGAPVVGARVRTAASNLAIEGTTDAEGRYQLSVAADAMEDWIPLHVEAGELAQPPDTTVVNLPKPHPTVVVHDVTLRPGAVVEARVLSPDGTPVRGASVHLLRPGESADADAFAIDGQTGEDGRVQVRPVWAEEGLRLVGLAEGYVATATAPFDAEPGRTVRPPDLRLLRGTILRVRATDSTGNPATDTILFVRRPAGRMARYEKKESGVIETERLAPGTAFLEVWSATCPSVHRRIDAAGAGDVQTIDVRLSPGVAVGGRIVDETGAPVSDHPTVRIGNRNTRADEEGRFQVSGVAPGPVEIRVFATGRGRHVVRLDEPRTDVEITLPVPPADVAARLTELETRWKEVEAARAASTDADEHARWLREAEDLHEERSSLSPPDAPPPPPAGAACGCGSVGSCG